MRVEQAIYTSLPRDGRAGYHVVSRSPGVSEEEVRSLATWSPSHEALLLDDANRVSVNFHPLTGGRWALARSCEGRPEYSGRGGRQVYTHALILDARRLGPAKFRPFALYRDALALGRLHYVPEPEPILDAVELGRCHGTSEPERRMVRLRALGLGDLNDARQQLAANRSVELRFAGDRMLLAECLLDLLPPEIVLTVSFSTSLQPSPARPYRLSLLR